MLTLRAVCGQRRPQTNQGLWGHRSHMLARGRAIIRLDSGRKLAWVALLFLAMHGVALVCQTPGQTREIHTTAELVALGNQKASHGPAVDLHATVTFTDVAWRTLFVQDSTGPIFVLIDQQTERVHAGDFIEVRGIAAPGAVAPIVTRPRIRILGRRSLKPSAKVSLVSLQTESFDSQIVETEGILRPSPAIWDHLSYLLTDGQQSISILIPSKDSSALEKFLGARVIVRGVVGTITDAQNRSVGWRLLVTGPSEVVLGEPEWAGPFALPVTPIAQVQAPTVTNHFDHPLRVKGTEVWKGTTGVVIASGSASIYADIPDTVDAGVGSQIEIVGYPKEHDGTVELRDGLLRQIDAPVVDMGTPQPLSAHSTSADSYAGRLVRMSGRFVTQAPIGKDYLFTLDDDGKFIKVLIPGTVLDNQLPTISPGTEVVCRGVLRIQSQKTGPQLEILAAKPSDLLVKTAPRVSGTKLMAAVLLLATLGVVLWIVQLRRSLRAQTIQIRSQLEHEIQIESRYRRLFERNVAGVFTRTPSGEILDCNTAFARMLGYGEAADVVGKNYFSFRVHVDSRSLDAIRESGTRGHETALKQVDGTIIYLLEHTICVDSEETPYFETVALDISESRRDKIALQNARDAAHRESLKDALTGLPNRRYFACAVKKEIESAHSAPSSIAVLYIDLDSFKAVNDTMGHTVGDQVLRHVALRLVRALGHNGSLCRIGGDEFAVILRYDKNSPTPEQIAEELLATLAQPFQASDTLVAIGASIGISMFPLTASDDTTLLQQADNAMYIAKRSGSNRIVIYSSEIGCELQEQNQLLAELKMAVSRDELYLEYQPEFDVRTGRLMRFEALARWNNALLGSVSPARFIPVAEESGLMVDIGRHILEMGCRDAAAWNAGKECKIPVAVNVSSIQLRNESFSHIVLETCRRTGLDPTLLELEMTESITLDARERAVNILTELRNAGVKLALDDFGTGYSCLSYLGDLPFDRLKVDRSFLRKADLGRGVPALMNAVLSVAHALSMSVVVEGIETRDELEFVSAMGADEVQGFLLGRPSTEPIRVIERDARFPDSTPTRSQPGAQKAPSGVSGDPVAMSA